MESTRDIIVGDLELWPAASAFFTCIDPSGACGEGGETPLSTALFTVPMSSFYLLLQHLVIQPNVWRVCYLSTELELFMDMSAPVDSG